MLTYTQFLTEVFGTPVPWEWDFHQSQHHEASFVINDMHFNVIFHHTDNFNWDFMFSRTDLPRYDRTKDKYGILGTGEQFKVFSTVIAILKDFLTRVPLRPTDHINFTADEPSRRKLYDRMITLVQHELPGHVGTNFGDGNYWIGRASLHEKFLDGVKSKHGYAEVFVNPDADELIEAGEKHGPSYGREKYGPVRYDIGGIMTATNLYVFNREKAEHNEVARQIPKLPPVWYPLYLEYYPKTGAVGISVSDWSTGHLKKEVDPSAVISKAKTHRGFRAFKKILKD